jgi:hypothetical protein
MKDVNSDIDIARERLVSDQPPLLLINLNLLSFTLKTPTTLPKGVKPQQSKLAKINGSFAFAMKHPLITQNHPSIDFSRLPSFGLLHKQNAKILEKYNCLAKSYKKLDGLVFRGLAPPPSGDILVLCACTQNILQVGAKNFKTQEGTTNA